MTLRKYIDIINEAQRLDEALMDIDNDVDMLYELGFKNLAEAIRNQELLKYEDTRQFTRVISSERLTSDLARQAHEKNPITIYMNHDSYSGNHYQPLKQMINLDMNDNALHVLFMFNGSVERSSQAVNDSLAPRFKKEFDEDRIKGTIHHELVHWIDDTLHNRHITKRVEQYKNSQKRPVDYTKFIDDGHKDTYLTNYEIQATIHNIYQAYKVYSEEEWNAITFKDILQIVPSVGVTYDRLQSVSDDLALKYKKIILKRMHREDILGATMR